MHFVVSLRCSVVISDRCSHCSLHLEMENMEMLQEIAFPPTELFVLGTGSTCTRSLVLRFWVAYFCMCIPAKRMTDVWHVD